MTTTADLLDEYGAALRGSWGDIDGRSERIALNELAELIRRCGNAPLDDATVVQSRDDLRVCPLGKGHWRNFCEDYNCDNAEL